MNKYIALLVVLTGLIILAGCGTTQQMAHFPDQDKLVEEQGKGRIYVIGSPFVMNLASHYAAISVIADEKLVGYIDGHSYLCWERETGVTSILVFPGYMTIPGHPVRKNVISLNVESGQVYFILAHIGPDWETVNFFMPGSGELAVRLEVVNAEIGREKLLKSEPPEHSK